MVQTQAEGGERASASPKQEIACLVTTGSERVSQYLIQLDTVALSLVTRSSRTLRQRILLKDLHVRESLDKADKSPKASLCGVLAAPRRRFSLKLLVISVQKVRKIMFESRTALTAALTSILAAQGFSSPLDQYELEKAME